MNVLPNKQHIIGILIFGPIVFKGSTQQKALVQDTITDEPFLSMPDTIDKNASNIQSKENRQIR